MHPIRSLGGGQEHVHGTVRVRLSRGAAVVVGQPFQIVRPHLLEHGGDRGVQAAPGRLGQLGVGNLSEERMGGPVRQLRPAVFLDHETGLAELAQRGGDCRGLPARRPFQYGEPRGVPGHRDQLEQ
jgi:hypothetical protein